MNAKKARKLRKALGMTKENLTQKEYGAIKHKAKMVYFKDSLGEVVPRKAERFTLVNKNKHYYRKVKKAMKKQKQGL